MPPRLTQNPQGYAIYQVTEIEPPQTPTFEQIKAKSKISSRRSGPSNFWRRRRKNWPTARTPSMT